MKTFSVLLAFVTMLSLLTPSFVTATSAENLPDEPTYYRPPTMWALEVDRKKLPDEPVNMPFDCEEQPKGSPVISEGEMTGGLCYFRSISGFSIPIMNYNRAVTVNEIVLAEVFPPDWDYNGIPHKVYSPFTAYEKLSIWYADGYGADMTWKQAKIKGCYTDTSEGFEKGLEGATQELCEMIGDIHIVFEEPVTAESFMIYGKELSQFELCIHASPVYSYTVYGPGDVPETEPQVTDAPATDAPETETDDSSSDSPVVWILVAGGAVAIVVALTVVIAVKKKKK